MLKYIILFQESRVIDDVLLKDSNGRVTEMATRWFLGLGVILVSYTVSGPCKTDTTGKVKFVLYKKVCFIQGSLNAFLIHFGTYTNVLYIEGVLNSGVSF